MDPALWELLKTGAAPGQEVEAIIRLRHPQMDVAGVRLVSRFGEISTCRLRLDAILDVRNDPNVLSLKAPRVLGDESEPTPVRSFPPGPADVRRPLGIPLTGAGVVVGIVDWGCDFDHPCFKRTHNRSSTRLCALWDQRRTGSAGAPRPYGYGAFYGARQINEALQADDPYDALGYHPAEADRDGFGCHGTHVMDIAAGSCGVGGPGGVAPEADLCFVHLANTTTGALGNLGDSVRILEAVDFIARIAGERPWVINLSVGRHCGPHDGSTLCELALDHLLRQGPGRFICQSAGNYFDKAIHASGRLEPGQRRDLTMITDEADLTLNELEVWYREHTELAARVESPTGHQSDWVGLGETVDILEDDRVVGRIYHRACDPNNNENTIELFLYAWAPAGRWVVSLEAVANRPVAFHAWLERDEACARCQARFIEADVDRGTTTGTIANGRLPLVVGAYDAHAPGRELTRFSSAGPTVDCRWKPDLVAPGSHVLAARSAPRGSTRSPGTFVRKNGTSMASPQAAGAVALCLQGAPRPLDCQEIRELLRNTAQPLNVSPRAGCGYLDTVGAVSALAELDRAPTRPRRLRPA